jgi:inorganic pyrophosphatase
MSTSITYRWTRRRSPVAPCGYAQSPFYLRDEQGPDTKLLCVPAGNTRWHAIHTIRDLPPNLLDKISHFFNVYKALEPGKRADVRGWQDGDHAEAVLTAGQRRYRERPSG